MTVTPRDRAPPALRIATCRPLPEPDVDEDLLLQALAARGVAARMAAWRDPAERWDEPVPTVVRSTWDYIHDVEAFRAWIRAASAAAPLWNPAGVMLDNLHKGYLVALAARGVPVVPTALQRRGDPATLSALAAARGWCDVVVKPAVGAGSHETHRVPDAPAGGGDDLLARLAARQDMLVQPYLRAVEGYGERALVFIDGEFTHAVRKAPRFAGGVEEVSAALPITAAERTVGEAALAPCRGELLYGRVDVAPGPDGEPVVMELELVEPSLFLLQEPRALARLADAIAVRLAGAGS
jgi:glutathione synthase/RimK-type ligase-like ATP-grasp enzyme